MEALRNLTYQEQSILTAIAVTTPISLNYVALIYKVVQSFDKTIAVINEAQQRGESALTIIEEMSQKISTIIDKIEE